MLLKVAKAIRKVLEQKYAKKCSPRGKLFYFIWAVRVRESVDTYSRMLKSVFKLYF